MRCHGVHDDKRVWAVAISLCGFLARADGRHASILVVEDDDTFQALYAFVVIYLTLLVNSVDAAAVSANLAGGATFKASFEPLKSPQSTQYCQSGTQWTYEAAVKFVDEHPQPQD